jgi:hypothetical protein
MRPDCSCFRIVKVYTRSDVRFPMCPKVSLVIPMVCCMVFSMLERDRRTALAERRPGRYEFEVHDIPSRSYHSRLESLQAVSCA